MSSSARWEVEALESSTPFRWLVRTGFLARGVTYGIVGALALALALGAGTLGTSPDQQGALGLLARGWLGRAALVVLAGGLLAYALWKLTQAVFGGGPEGGGGPGAKDRIANLGGCLAYVMFFIVAVHALSGASGSSSRASRHAAAGVLGWPGGTLLVGAGAVALLLISLYQMFDAARGDFAKDNKLQQMGRAERRTFTTLGRIGLIARAFVFALIGYFLLRTAIDFNAGSTVGVDGALARLDHQTFGPWILGAVGAGLLTFAAFSMFEARYRRL